MFDPNLLAEAIVVRGYTCIPLAEGTKVPLVAWKDLQVRKASEHEMRAWFERFPYADIGLVTGVASGLIALDFDHGPFINGKHNATPSGGRHYFYRYTPGDRRGLSVRPGLDIPWIVRLYAMPDVNDEPIPIQPDAPMTRPSSQHTFNDSTPPPATAMDACAFVRWFKVRRDEDWPNRYALARAYASNAAACEGADRRLGNDYRHEAAIYSNLSKPISCAQIVRNGYPCPHFDLWSDTCRKAAGVTTPFGLATRTQPR